MNTFLLAAVALGLIAFLMVSRKRRAAASSGTAEGRPKGRSRRKAAAAPPPPPPAPAAAMAETAASRTLSPAMDPLPGPGAPPPSFQDWAPAETIVEPGWPLPGEIAGSWPSGPPSVTDMPPAHEPLPAPAPEPAAEEWSMPPASYETRNEPEAAPAEPSLAEEPLAEPATEALMEAWVPGVVEDDAAAEGPAFSGPAAGAFAADDPPALVWTDPEPAEAPAGDEVAGPPPWSPEPLADAPVDPPAEEIAVPETVEAEPEPEPWQPADELPPPPAEEPVWIPVAPAASGPDPIVARETVAEPGPDAGGWSREIAALLPRAVEGASPLLAASDQIGVTPRMLAVLRALAERPRGLPEAARDLGVSRPVVADICSRLEVLGFVRRERDARDRRRLLVVPTEKGLRAAGESAPGIDPEAVAAALQGMSHAEREALASGLRALVR